MIVDLNLKGKLVIIVGAGNEGLKKINSLLTQDCKILVISDSENDQIINFVADSKIEFIKEKIENADFIKNYEPILVIASTNNKELNRKIVVEAKKKRCYAYASDDPEFSDFSHPSVINIQDSIQVAISTGGSSPVMARKIKEDVEKIIVDSIDKVDIYHIKLQKIIRDAAKSKISTLEDRKKYLYTVLNDKYIKQLLKDDNFSTAQDEAMRILKDWK